MPGKNGVTLIEIVISALILAVAFIPILRVVNFGSKSTAKIGNYAKAARLAQQLIEECKHVPFKVVQKTYTGLKDNQEFDVNPQFYKQTQKSIEKFFNDNKSAMKDYGFTAKLKPHLNALNQITEVWFNVEIFWRDMGKKDDAKRPKRIVRAGNAYYNSEAK